MAIKVQSVPISGLNNNNQVLSGVGDPVNPSDGVNFRTLDGGYQKKIRINNLGNKAGLVTIDTSSADYFNLTAAGNLQIALTNPSSTYVTIIVINIKNGGSHTISYPANTKFAFGIVPSLQASGSDELVFRTSDTGATWLCSASLQDYK